MDLFSPALLHGGGDDDPLVLRPLQEGDYDKGFLSLLSQLTVVGHIDRLAFNEQFHHMKTVGSYFIVVIEDKERHELVGSASLLVERKFIHGLGKMAHIEDVVVLKSYRGKRLGKRLIDALMRLSDALGCYKVTLDCSEENVAFYSHCGLERKEVQMVHYFRHNDREQKDIQSRL